jgi:DNA repair exonuclease SbcCD ATPase subunit
MRLNIQEIRFKNLFSYGNQWQTFTPSGISFITGLNLNNDRRNFTGKSNLLKIFPFALFGKVEDLTKARMINWKNRKEAECYITIKKGNDTFVIRRGIKPDILEVTKNGNTVPEPSNKRDFQAQIEQEILGIDYTTFMNVVYADTNNSNSILKMSKPAKREFLENLFDLGYYTKLKDRANKKRLNIVQDIGLIEKEIEHNQRRIEEFNQFITKRKEEILKIKDSKPLLLNKENELAASLKNVTTSSKEIGNIQDEIEVINKIVIKKEQIIFKLKSKAKELSRFILKDEEKVDLKSLENKIIEIEESILDYNLQLNIKNERYSKFNLNLDNVKDELLSKVSVIKSDIEKFKEVIKNNENVDTANLENKILELDELLEIYNRHQKENKDNYSKFNPDLDTQKDNLIKETSFHQTNIANHKKEIKALKDKLENKIDFVECPLCFNKVDHEHIEKILNGEIEENESSLLKEEIEFKKCNDKLNEKYDLIGNRKLLKLEIEKLEKNITSTKNDLDLTKQSLKLENIKIIEKQEAETTLKDLQLQYKSHNDNLTEKYNLIKERNELKKEIEQLKENIISSEKKLDLVKKSLETEKDKLYKIEKSNRYKKAIRKLLVFKNYENEIVELTNSKSQLENTLQEHKNVLIKYESLEKEIEEIRREIFREEDEKKYLNNLITESENKINSLSEKITEYKNTIIKHKTTKDYLECIKEICSDERAKKYTISNKIPLLNQRTNYYLGKAGVNYYVKLDNWLEVEFKGPGIKDACYANLSGAEKVSLDRSLQFALNDINKLQSPTYFDLMILDEILDSSVDEIGLQNIVNIVKAKQVEDKSNILIVSHKQSFNELEDLIDNFYCVEFDGKYSNIKRM